ncbi:cellulose binding domain-containing protein [Micromonospora sp. WMMC241]|uniref:cellulose binding domain-containing protein n=1 Tax=Micromonospora sp. WMMC241 TaxID=3015159 RepID=UPI0022B664CC|nr:cellulose binding domain-containing protein [Micromonospora sp. WMMC241]MCZ7438161.1 cellulose binding domain-containing protein [Micromonospora sp. WMMC241]
MARRSSIAGALATAAVLVAALAGAALSSNPGAASAAEVSPLAATAGCGKAPTLGNGTYTITSSGKNRSFILKLPDGYDRNRQYRLVFGFHWWGGTAVDVATGQTVQRDVWSYYGLLRLSNNSTIFVAPQGISNGWANSGGEDVTFVDDMLRRIEGDLCVDTTQRFSVGFSYGGGMSYALACARPNVFRAVAVQSSPGTLSGCSGGTQPIAYLGVHGIGDNIASGRALRDRFVANNGCTAASPPEPRSGSLTHTVYTYSGCRPGYPVAWAAFDGGHIAAPQDGAGGDSGSRTWVPAEVWKFFTQFAGTTPTPSPTASPTSSPTASPTASPTNPPPSGGCAATYRTTTEWPGGFQGEVTVTAGAAAISGWRVSWTLANGQSITQLWGGRNAPSGSTQNVSNEAWNGSLAAGASTTFGFTANGSATTPSLTCTRL